MHSHDLPHITIGRHNSITFPTLLGSAFLLSLWNQDRPSTSFSRYQTRYTRISRSIYPLFQMDRSNLKERAAEIATTAVFLSDELAQLGLPDPSFEQGLPGPLYSDAPDSSAGAARQRLLQMLDEFRALLTEPTLLLTPELVSLLEHTSFACH